MAHDPDNNRSSALSPEILAIVHSAVASSVSEAVKSVFENMVPVFKDMAITPEKLREANRPYEDPAKTAREARESQKSKEDEAEIAKMTAQRRANCPHLDKNGRTSICLVHNQPDHQPRGVCVICGDWIYPKEWRIAASDEKNPRGRAYLVEPHKDYKMVLLLESTS